MRVCFYRLELKLVFFCVAIQLKTCKLMSNVNEIHVEIGFVRSVTETNYFKTNMNVLSDLNEGKKSKFLMIL